MASDLDRAKNILLDGFGRIDDGVGAVLDGLSIDDLLWRPDPDGNSIGWLVWHLTRQQDAQIAHLGDTETVWSSGGWHEKLALPYSRNAHGYGMSSADVGRFSLTDTSLLTRYQSATRDLTARVLEQLTAQDFDRVIDTSWDPPVTVAVRVYSVLEDAAKHLGQAEYVRGLIERK